HPRCGRSPIPKMSTNLSLAERQLLTLFRGHEHSLRAQRCRIYLQTESPSMMAPDRTPNSSALDPAIVSDLAAALSRSLKAGSHGDELRGLLSRAALDARQKGIHAEQLLLVLKDIWYSLPQLATRPGNDTQTRLLQQLIARCIQEYYAG